jgi:hypothetical protein
VSLENGVVVEIEGRLVQEGSEQGIRQFNQVVYPLNGHLRFVSVFSSYLQEGQPD